jgi:hypothetical protein
MTLPDPLPPDLARRLASLGFDLYCAAEWLRTALGDLDATGAGLTGTPRFAAARHALHNAAGQVRAAQELLHADTEAAARRLIELRERPDPDCPF